MTEVMSRMKHFPSRLVKMFNSMKNQFREKTGRELPKFTPQKGGLSRQSRQGSESSVCSLVLDGAQQQVPPAPSPTLPPQEPPQIKLLDGKVLSPKEVNVLAKKEDEWRNRLEKTVTEWTKKLEKRENELQQSFVVKEEEWRKKECALTEDLLKQTNELQEALKVAEEMKRLNFLYQEDKHTLESFQTQEMAKVKHLLLAKEKECSETTASLKEATTLLESLKAEVNRLRPFEEQISNYEVGRLSRQAGEEGAERRLAEAKVTELETKLEEEAKEKQNLSIRVKFLTEQCNTLASELKAANDLVAARDDEISKLTKKVYDTELFSRQYEDTSKKLENELKPLKEKYETTQQELNSVRQEFADEKSRLDTELAAVQEKLTNLQDELEKEKNAKNDALLKNAQVSQEVDMARQDLRQQQADVEEYLRKVNSLEETLKQKDQILAKNVQEIQQLSTELGNIRDNEKETEYVEKGLRDKITDLEEQVTEKNKAIKVLKQKLADMKKTLQKELKVCENDGTEMMNSHNHSTPHKSNLKENGDTEVNFLYMKNVIMKFLTSREYEALHLTKAVATLLKLSAEEECLLKDTIGWRMSWFRSKPPRLEDYTPS
ncbi:golgin subfamily A member 1 isoform X3 [Cimex lectularius]|uniref:GRIP domain-containing protein n=1 Tax=Cimex lectularius TaxID=79782 RepID=A0A8I6RVH0_CIMLE|nr:golgin subfamily A member 1 isoform X3 [Cimex lectularius]